MSFSWERCRSDEEEEYDFEYSDEEQETTDFALENKYYSAKAIKAQDPRAAVEAFREASPTSEWDSNEPVFVDGGDDIYCPLIISIWMLYALTRQHKSQEYNTGAIG